MIKTSEILKNQDTYYFNTDFDMDNIKSMIYFIENFLELEDFEIIEDDGTLVTLSNKKNIIYLISGGNGDFFSHKIDFEIGGI